MSAPLEQRRAAVLGSPIAHSLSPVLHRAAYEALGMSGWRYEAVEVDQDGLAGFLDGLGPQWAGLSLTMPLKAAVLPLLDAAAPLVEVVGAANTVLLRDGLRVGDNTDVPGLAAALAQAGVGRVDSAVVLGGGATARSAVAALAGVTGQVRAYLRDPGRGGELAAVAERVGVALGVRPWDRAVADLHAPLVVNTTPAGAADALAAGVPSRPGVLFEVLYHPWPTPLAHAWTQRGGQVIDGVALLVHQAVLQVELMTGAAVDRTALASRLRTAAHAALR